MRVGIDATSWANPRGYGRFTRELIGAVLRTDVPHVFELFIDEPSFATLDLPKANWIVVPTSVAPTLAAVARGRRTIPDVLRLSRAVSRRALDLFVFPTVYTWFPLAGRAKVLLGIHDVIADEYPSIVFPDSRSRALWRIKGRLARAQADWIMTVSEYSKREIHRRFGWDPETIAVVPEAPSPELAGRPSGAIDLSRWGVVPDARFLVYVGGMNPHKNLVRLVGAFARVRARHGFPDLLLLVGDAEGDRFTPGLAELRAAIARHGVEDVVRFTGFIEDRELGPLLGAARALVLPSLAEGYGLPGVEAAACGTPVIATRNSPLPEILEGGGIFIDPFREDEVERAIESMMDDGFRDRAAAIALARSRELSWDRSARVFLGLLERIGRR